MEYHDVANDQELLGRACVGLVLAGYKYSDLGITEDINEISEHLSKALWLMCRHFTQTNQEKFTEWLVKKTAEYL